MKKIKILKTVSQTTVVLIFFALLPCCQSNNSLFEYFTNAELQYETKAQEKYITEALNDILNLPEKELKQKRYEDYMGKEYQWNLHELICHHFVPDKKEKTLGNNFYHNVKSKEVQNQIKKIIANMQDDKQTPEIKVENIINFNKENNENNIVEFTLIVTNLSDTLSVQALYDNIFKHAKFIVNNNEVTNPVALGGLEEKREKEVHIKNQSVNFTWITTAEYLKNEYGNIFSVQWKYLDTYSNILEVNIKDETIVEIDERRDFQIDSTFINSDKIYNPIEYLEFIKNSFNFNKSEVCVIPHMPDEWIKEEHIPQLMKLIYSKERTKCIMSIYSSYFPIENFSTVGREAQNLIDCYRFNKKYPNFINSSGESDKSKAKEIEEWWNKK